MNERDRTYDWLKHRRNYGLINENINLAFLIVIWLLGFKVVFWIFLVLTILDMLIRMSKIEKTRRELNLR